MRAASHGACRRHLIGVHVVVFAVITERQARYHRHDPRCPQALDTIGIHRANLADEAEVRRLLLRGAKHSQIAAADTDRRLTGCPDRCHQLLVELSSKHHDRDISRLGVSNPQAVHEARLAPKSLQRAAQCRSATVHYDNLMTLLTQSGNRRSKLLHQFLIVQGSSADLDDEFHCKPAFSSKPNIKFMFCTACPAAPFKRLSMHDTSTTREPSGESEKPISQ